MVQNTSLRQTVWRFSLGREFVDDIERLRRALDCSRNHGTTLLTKMRFVSGGTLFVLCSLTKVGS